MAMPPSVRQNVDQPPADQSAARHIDGVDRAIIEALLGDGRVSLTDLADSVNVSRSTAHARVQRLRDANIITGFTATVDHAALGLDVAALVFIDIDQHDWRALRDVLLEQVQRIDGIRSTETIFILDEARR